LGVRVKTNARVGTSASLKVRNLMAVMCCVPEVSDKADHPAWCRHDCCPSHHRRSDDANDERQRHYGECEERCPFRPVMKPHACGEIGGYPEWNDCESTAEAAENEIENEGMLLGEKVIAIGE